MPGWRHARNALGVASVAAAFLWLPSMPVRSEQADTAASNKKLVETFYREVLNGTNLDAAGEFVAEDAIGHTAPPETPRGSEGLRQSLAVFTSACPDLKPRIVGMIAEGDRVAVLGEMTGVNTGAYTGSPATGKAISVRYIEIYRLAGGRIAEHWDFVDEHAMQQQLGVMPGADGPDPALAAVQIGPGASADATSADALKAVVRRFNEDVMSSGDASAVEEVCGPEFVCHISGQPPEMHGLRWVTRSVTGAHDSFPDLRMEVEDAVAEGDLVAARLSATGTHGGRYMGVAATGKAFSFGGISLYRVTDGKITEEWTVADRLSLLRQLDMTPPAPGPAPPPEPDAPAGMTFRFEPDDTLRIDSSARHVDAVDIETFGGAIRLTGDDSAFVEIVATRVVSAPADDSVRTAAKNVTVEVGHEGGTLQVCTRAPTRGPRSVQGVQVAYAVSLPRRLAARVITWNGAVTVTGLDGPVDAYAANGAIALTNVAGVVEATTNNGAVTLVVDGALAAPVTMHCDNGNVSAHVGALRDDIELDTANGDIDITIEDTLAGGIDARASMGAVRLHVPSGAALSLHATSGSGRIRTPWGSGGRELSVNVNGGGPAVMLQSASGAVRVTE